MTLVFIIPKLLYLAGAFIIDGGVKNYSYVDLSNGAR